MPRFEAPVPEDLELHGVDVILDLDNNHGKQGARDGMRHGRDAADPNLTWI